MIQNLLRFVSVSYKGTGTLEVYEDVPGGASALIATITLSTITTRQEQRFQLPFNTRALNLRLKGIPDAASTLLLYAVRVYAKALGVGVTAWRWVPIPIPGVSEEWTSISIPIPPTPEEWQRITIPIPPTPEEWTRVNVVADTNTDWRWVDMPNGEAS